MKYQSYTTITLCVLLGFALSPVATVYSVDEQEDTEESVSAKIDVAAYNPAKKILGIKDQSEFDKVVYVSTDEYTGDIPGNHKNLSPKKWYYAMGFFHNNELKETRSFPASLLVTPEDLEKSKPTWIGFMPNEQAMLAIEGDRLIKYNIRADYNIVTGKAWFSVDFGKRTDIAQIDPSYKPFGDSDDDIFFKKTDEVYYKWESKSETIKELKKEPKRPEQKEVSSARIEDDGVRIGDHLLFRFDASLEKVDPLAVDEDRLIGAYKGYGTQTKPVSERDYKDVINSTVIDSGKLLALSKMLNAKEKIICKFEDAKRSVFDKNLAQMCKTATGKKGMIREIKLLAREMGGVTSGLKKTKKQASMTIAKAMEMMSDSDNLIEAKMMFDKVKGYDGAKWFDQDNENDNIKALFMYLASLDDKGLDAAMKKMGLTNLIAKIKVKGIVNAYKTTWEFKSALKNEPKKAPKSATK
jgi:hypothetical protein